MSDNTVDISEALARRRLAEARRLQFEFGRDGLDDYTITAGAILDAISRGVLLRAIHHAFNESKDALEFEARLWSAPVSRRAARPTTPGTGDGE